MPTAKDVAGKAGVSIATVYKVFSSNYSTREQVRKKVLEAAESLGYTHKTAVQATAGGRSRTIGLIVCDSAASNGFYHLIIRELIKELDRYSYRLVTLFTERNTISERDAIKTMMELKLDGLILMPVSSEPIDLVLQLQQSHFPMLQLFQRVYPEMDTVLFDDVSGTKVAVRHLLQCGHERIMLLSRHSRHDRVKGYTMALEEAGMEIDPALIRVLSYNQNVREMIRQEIEGQKPTAILSVGEGITTCTLQALREMRLSIPEDISLIAYDDFSWLAAYGVSAVSHPFEAFGSMAVKLLLERMDKPLAQGEQPHLLVMDPMLVVRDSIRILR